MTNKKPESTNPIEEAIGERAEDPKAQEKFTKEFQTEPIPENNSPQTPHDLDEPTPAEMLTLEELNRQTEGRLQDEYPETTTVSHTVPKVPIIPVSKSDLLPVTKTSFAESPPQRIDEIDEYQDAEKHERHVKAYNRTAEKLGIPQIETPPAEDIELTALRKYILEDGFVLATVAMHIVSLCAEPMTAPSTTMWDFRDRASIPEMVLALLNQPGYIEGIWPSLRIVMSSNKGNAAWCAGIATTIAFFDVVRTLPALKEVQNEVEKKS